MRVADRGAYTGPALMLSPSPSAAQASSTTTTIISPSLTSARSPSNVAQRTMLKFWPSTPADLTPKAGPDGKERRNPFDSLSHDDVRLLALQSQHQPSSVPTTPSYHHHLLHTSAHAPGTPTTSAPASYFPPPGPLTPGGTHPVAQPTTGLSLHAPVFKMQQPPPSRRPGASRQPSKNPSPASSASSSVSSGTNASGAQNGTMSSSGPSKGQIHVKLIQARGLNVRSSHSKPYAVVQFEQNEFVGRDPIEETEKEAKGIATNLSRQSSSTALSALTAMTIGKDGKGGQSNSLTSANGGAPKSGLNGLFGSRMSAMNPVWKHEVSLCVPRLTLSAPSC